MYLVHISKRKAFYPAGIAYAKAQKSEHMVCLGNHKYFSCCRMEHGE